MLSVKSIAARLDELERHIQEHKRAGHSEYIIPDSDLGWTIVPLGRHHTLPYSADEQGCRSIPFARRTNCSKARLGFFGDSFIHGDEVSDEDTALSQLQLLIDGVVINGGVSGYGTDQALMRLERSADTLCCTWFFLGIASCDETRNLNILRSHHSPASAIPYMKPRFIKSAESLRVVYPPPVDGRPLREHYLDAKTQEFLKNYDAFYPQKPTLASRLTSAFSSGSRYVCRKAARQETARALTLQIVDRFWRFVRRRNSRGTLLLIPNWHQLANGSGDLDYYRSAFHSAAYPFWDLADVFHRRQYQRFANEDLWCRNGHFSPLSSRWVAEAIAAHINAAGQS